MEPVKESVRRYWDKEAGGFDLAFGHGLRDGRHREIWLDILQRNIPRRRLARILDVGCGTGFLALLLSELGHEAVGLDFSAEMLSVAREKAKNQGLAIEFHNGDAERPPFPPESFDHVVCRDVFHLSPAPGP